MINQEEIDLEESRWLERLAYRMVRDQDEAKDVVQETYLAALKSPKPSDRPRKGWLRNVATNVVRMEYRGRTRRQGREESMAQPEPSDDSLGALQKLEATQALTTAVQALAEPYRTAVLLRFVDELSMAEVAVRQGVPVGTAGWRVSEGLKRLRVTLDSDSKGDCRPWLLALCPTVDFPNVVGISETQASIARTSGANPMTKLSILFAAICAASTVAYVGFAGGESHPKSATLAAKVAAQTQVTVPLSPTPKDTPSSKPPVKNAASPAPSMVDLISAEIGRRPSFAISFSADGEYQDEWALDLLPSLSDTMELLSGCYSDMLVRQPDLRGVAGTVHVDVNVEQVDGQVGIATDTEHHAHFGTQVDDEFRECMRESSFVLEFEPPSAEVQQGLARITMQFPDGSEAGKAKQAAAKACLDDLQQRRPAMFSEGDFNDPIFASCMYSAYREMEILSQDVLGEEELPEAFRACVELRHSSTPSEFDDCIKAAGGTVTILERLVE